MGIFRPNELRTFLEEQGAGALKSLSQNFLIDGNIVRKILAAAAVCPSDTCIEIGPGPGALTEALLQAGAHVIAIEKDKKFAAALYRLQNTDHCLTVYEDDAVTIDTSKLLKEGSARKLISNLPYHLTTPLITRFLPLYPEITSITVMVQKEVAQRFVAKPGTPNSSSISLFIRLFSEPRWCFDVPANCFYPKPSVVSSVIHFDLKHPPPGINPEKFERLARTAFQKRRKMLRSSLKEVYPAKVLSRAFEHTGIDPSCRPEELSFEQFTSLYRQLFDDEEPSKLPPLPA
ncbi:MAG: ribosomal RNA small subunit methyltransferase A [Simkania sp.]|nr:ribosomal RNA small subunit methyltransferase A [Simkania sp.]